MILNSISSFNTIAIIQTAFIGDTVLALHLCSEIKALHTNCRLIFVCAPNAASVVNVSYDVDKVVVFDKRGAGKGKDGINRTAEILRENEVDCVICLHKSLRSTLLAKLSKAKYTVGFDKGAMSFLFDKRVKYKIHLHERSRNRETLKAFAEAGISVVGKPKINFSEIDIKYIDEIFDTLTGTPIVLAPGSVWPTKKWASEHFVELAKLLKESGYSPIVIGGKEDETQGEEIALNSGAINLCGKTNIPQSIYAISKAKLIITNDSAPIHFAGLVNARTIALFGPTSPVFGFAPLGDEDVALEREKLTCKPCAIHGGKTCPLQTHDCMRLIKPEEVLEALNIKSKIYK